MNDLTTVDDSRRSDDVREPARTEENRHQYLSFHLHGRSYAIDGLSVREIIQYQRPTRISMANPCVHGVINLRGAVVPVIDLGLRFGQAKTRVDRRTCIIIVEVSDDDSTQPLGILVDAVSEVLEVAPHEMNPPPAFGNPVRSDFIQAMVRRQDDFIIVLTIANTLAIRELSTQPDEKQAVPT